MPMNGSSGEWNEWNAAMLPLGPDSFTDGFTGAQLADHFGVEVL